MIHRWMAVAMLTLLAHYASEGWPLLALMAVAGYAVLELLPNGLDTVRGNKLINILILAVNCMLIAKLLPEVAVYWPGKASQIVIPLSILLMAAWGDGGKPEHTMGVLGKIMIVLAVPVGIALMKNGKWEELIPQRYQGSWWPVVTALLIPLAVRLEIREEGNNKWYAFTTAVSVLLWAAMGAVLGNGTKDPVRELGRRLMIGPYSRFEMVISILMTLGWYGLISLLIRCATAAWRQIGGNGKIGGWISTFLVLTFALMGDKIPLVTTLPAIVSVWLIIPIFELKKISKKSKKST